LDSSCQRCGPRAPQLVATAPNQVWTWDIPKLLGPAKWTDYYLSVILDIYSRSVVGWMLARRESQYLAERLIHETLLKEGIPHRSTADPQRSWPSHAILWPWRNCWPPGA